MNILVFSLFVALTLVSLIAIYQRRQRRGLESLLDRVLHRESFYADSFTRQCYRE